MINATNGEDLPQRAEALQTESISDEYSDDKKERNLGEQDKLLTSQSKRTANIYRDTSGEPRGAALWLNTTELAAAGVNVDDADAVKIRIEDGDLKFESTRDKEYE